MSAAAQAPVLEVRPVIAGEAPSVTVSGLVPGQPARIASVRAFEVWINETGDKWRPKTVPVLAWADIKADAKGGADLATFDVLSGSWTGADPYGVFWSGRKLASPDVPAGLAVAVSASDVKLGETKLFVLVQGRVAASASAVFAEPPGLAVQTVSEGRLNGVYAAPAGAKGLPVIILLHGSEGGSTDGARRLAVRFAGQGFAAFALNYFAWDMSGIETIPNVHINTPIELIGDARDWIAKQPEADVTRLGVYGHSKGAEFAAVAAVRYPWIRAVAACVPSDVVWEGYGIGDPRASRARPVPDPVLRSSWSWQGEPLAYIRLRPYVDGNPEYFNNTERYERSRKDDLETDRLALIPVEQSPANFLLLGGGKDEVWASGEMATRLAARLKSAGRESDVTALVFPEAGHGICGDGTYPPHLWSDPSSDPRVKDLIAEGDAAVKGWQAIGPFFKRTLTPSS